jgi:hypothetical protein
MKWKNIIAILIFFCSTSLTAQDWIYLKQPQSNLLGREIVDVNGGDPIFKARTSIPNVKIDTVDGSNYLESFEQEYLKFVTGVIDKEKMNIVSVKAFGIKLKSLNEENFENGIFGNGAKFAYAGVTADSVTITLENKNKTTISSDKVTKFISNNIPGKVSKIVEFTLDKTSYQKKDTLKVSYTINCPDIFFKASFIQLKEGKPRKKDSWELYYKHFYNETGGKFDRKRTILNANDFNYKEKTYKIYPRFSQKKHDVKTRLYFFKAEKINNELVLNFYLKDNISGNGEKLLMTIPSVTLQAGEKNPSTGEVAKFDYKYFIFDNHKIDEFDHPKLSKIKLVYLSCYAEQIVENGKSTDKIKIFNYDTKMGAKGEKISRKYTFMKYPEIDIKYLN